MYGPIDLIAEVEKRPELYNIHLKEYSNKAIRNELWNEICAKLHDNWESLNTKEQIEYSQHLRRKWKHIRDEFQRENKMLNDPQSNKSRQLRKRKYAHYDRMQFLSDFVESSPNYVKPLPIAEKQLTASTIRTRTVSNVSTPVHKTFSVSSLDTNIKMKKEKQKATKKDGLKEIKAILTESIKLEKDERDLDRLGNKSFLMSLVPLMNRLEDDVIAQTRIKILQAIQDASSFIIDPK